MSTVRFSHSMVTMETDIYFIDAMENDVQYFDTRKAQVLQ